MQCEFILGDVRNAEVYGYRLYNDKEGYLLIVNPTYLSQNVNVNLKDFNNKNIDLSLLIKNGCLTNNLIQTFNGFTINMNEFEYLLYKYKIVNNNYQNYNDSKIIEVKDNYKEIELNKNDSFTLKVNNKDHLIISFKDLNNNPLRTIKGYPDGLNILNENNTPLKDNLPCEAIWSGISWLYLNTKGSKEIKISYKGEPIIMNYRFDK